MHADQSVETSNTSEIGTSPLRNVETGEAASEVQTRKYREQLDALMQASSDQLKIKIGGQVTFERFKFDEAYEEYVRNLTNPNGRFTHNLGNVPEELKVQNKLVRSWGWFHGHTGFSCMFKWASGRQDAYVILDNPAASPEAIAAQKAQIEQFIKGEHNVTVC